jgi:hypothetical protein
MSALETAFSSLQQIGGELDDARSDIARAMMVFETDPHTALEAMTAAISRIEYAADLVRGTQPQTYRRTR